MIFAGHFRTQAGKPGRYRPGDKLLAFLQSL